jgi:hypothetical protein
MRLAAKLGDEAGRLTTVFALMLFAVAIYMIWRSAPALIA